MKRHLILASIISLCALLPSPSFSKTILFGDLHVHTTYSFDGDLYSLRTFGDDGAHPPDDACAFARYCSKIDFYALTDHGESFTPERWKNSIKSMQQCNARFAKSGDPELMAFLGWEWTQVGDTPETHFGHKNIVYQGLRTRELPPRPVGALKGDEKIGGFERFLAGGLKFFKPFADYFRLSDVLSMMGDLATQKPCPESGDPQTLSKTFPANCRENISDPEKLFKRLDQGGSDYLAIPHGTAWGTYTPPGSEINNLLNPKIASPPLVEIYSGHGNNEAYRDFPEGGKTCPSPTKGFLTCCWRAGEIMRSRCQGLSTSECERRVELAKKLALEAGNDPYSVFLDAKPEDWLDCGQCRDCFKPVYNYRARESVQYALAISDFDHLDSKGQPLRFEFGFTGSSDNHAARPGTGYKQFARKYMTDVRGYKNSWLADHLENFARGDQKDPQMPQARQEAGRLLGLFDVEWGSSFFYPGGLIAVHAESRSRDSVWQAMKRREVYATSGPKILLWFDLLNAPSGPIPMGSQVKQKENPRFKIRAQGSFKQKPGCPEESMNALGAGEIKRLCRGECENPSNERHAITALEVVRIRPQKYKGEPLETLIEDSWKRFECPSGQEFCEIEFEDPEYFSRSRDTVYYVRALQEPTLAINGGGYRTRFDRDGNPIAIQPCAATHSSNRDDCLAPVQERAWSSPIFVHWK